MKPSTQESLIPIKTEVIPATPASILELAIKQGTNPDTLVKLLELQERWEAVQARKAFEEAFADFKAHAPKLEKTKPVSFGETAYKYTPLDAIANTLGPVLADHGLNYNWKQEATKDSITVTCVLRHIQGHSIENTLSSGPDPSGKKNGIQAIGSAVSYLRRYTLLGVLGIATSDEDMDGAAMLDAADFLSLIGESRTIEELKKNYQEAVKDGLAKQSAKAVELYMNARKKRELELRKP